MEEKTFVLCKCGKWIPKQCYNHHLTTKKHKRYIWEQNCNDADVTVPTYINELLSP
jgi:hypothetical protein